MTDPGDLRSEILRRIGLGTDFPISDPEFDGLALAVFGYQFGCNAPYRAFCERRGADPHSVRHWTEVPAVPTDAFKAVPLLCGDPSRAEAVWETSGTTLGAERRGRHFLPELALYDAALRAGFRVHLLPDEARLRMISLVPPPAQLPRSSLSHMIDETLREFGAPGSGYAVGPEGIDRTEVCARLRTAEERGEPVCLLGTSFAFVHLLDALEEREMRFRLPPGSRIMDTGGFKGRSREVSRAELYAAFGDRLGVATEWCVNEYGMTEMSSQFYDAVAGAADTPPPAERPHRGPPWVRTRAVDPETLAPLPEGEVGVLRHWDLANLHTVMAIQTADLGTMGPDGFRVLGRARGAEARGCSLAMDEMLSALRKGGASHDAERILP